MSTYAVSLKPRKSRALSLDSWAVLSSLLAALLIRAGFLTHIPW